LPQLKIDPEYVTAKEIGDLVTVNVTIQDVMEDWKIVGFEWKVRFNTTLLQGLEVIEGDYLASEAAQAAAETGGDYGTYFHAIWEGDYVLSFTLYYEYPWPPEIFPGHYSTGGVLATLTFNVTYKPTFADLVASCDLLLTDILLVDVEGNTVEYKPPVSGRYEIAVAAPPWLSLEPKEYTAEAIGEEFPLTVFINELSSDWRLVGVEFKIRYNNTMLDVVNITEAGFMRHFAELAGTETWFQYYVEEDPESGFGIVGILLLPLPNGTWPGPFPSTEDYAAPGDLATVTFEAIYQHEELDLTSDIYLDDIILANSAGKEIPYDRAKTAEEGKTLYSISRARPPIPTHPDYPYSIDVFTQYSVNVTTGEIDWENPYGGLGYNRTSDAFPPQALVKLYAYVSYYDDPVADKPVSFELVGPEGTVFTVVITTDADGIATLTYVLPWDVTGVWKVTATVALGGKQISDYLKFMEDWLVKAFIVKIQGLDSLTALNTTAYSGDVFNATTSKYLKGETLEIQIDLVIITMQNPRVAMEKIYGEDVDMLLKITVLDDLSQPVATACFDIDDLIEDAKYEDNPDFSRTVPVIEEVSFKIASNAFSGPADVYFNVFTDDPGVPYCLPAGIQIWLHKG